MNHLTAMDSFKIQTAEIIIDRTFVDNSLLWEALQMAGSGVISAGGRRVQDGNKRLAVLGDAVAEGILCADWYTSGAVKGRWSHARAAVLGNENLARVGRNSGLDGCYNTNHLNPIRNPSPAHMATLVEAILGAVYLDTGCDPRAVKNVMEELGLSYANFETQMFTYMRRPEDPLNPAP